MIKTKKKELITLFKSLGLKKNNNVLFHTSLIPFGKIEGGVGSIFEAAKKIIGDEGNIIVPTFTYSFRRKQVYNIKKSPSYPLIGLFSEHVRKKKNSYRNTDPLFSFSCIGPDKKKLILRKSINCFGKNSVYERLFKKDILIINLGIKYSTGLTAFMHLEKEANVFYRKDKIFTGKTLDLNGNLIKDKAKHFIKVKSVFKNYRTYREGIGEILEKKKISKYVIRNKHKHFSLKLKNFREEVLEQITKKPDLMLKKI